MNYTMVCGAGPGNSAAVRRTICGGAGKKVRRETVKSMVRASNAPTNPDSYSLCLSSECDVVYFGPAVFRKKDVQVRVWFKEREHPITAIATYYQLCLSF